MHATKQLPTVVLLVKVAAVVALVPELGAAVTDVFWTTEIAIDYPVMVKELQLTFAPEVMEVELRIMSAADVPHVPVPTTVEPPDSTNAK
jgi:hypothetical protein